MASQSMAPTKIIQASTGHTVGPLETQLVFAVKLISTAHAAYAIFHVGLEGLTVTADVKSALVLDTVLKGHYKIGLVITLPWLEMWTIDHAVKLGKGTECPILHFRPGLREAGFNLDYLQLAHLVPQIT